MPSFVEVVHRERDLMYPQQSGYSYTLPKIRAFKHLAQFRLRHCCIKGNRIKQNLQQRNKKKIVGHQENQ